LQVYIVLFSLLLANLAWLVNPHACCPRLDDILSSREMGCSLKMNSACDLEMVQADSSYYQINSKYMQLTLNDQFTKGVNNYIAETNAASIPSFMEINLRNPFSAEAVLDQMDYNSNVVPPIEIPPIFE
jgi:hypothetical protein